MSTVSRGFKGRGRRPSAGLPPGQYLVEDFPGLSAGPTPSIDLDDWELTVLGTTWEGVSLDTLLEGLETSAGFALAESYGGDATNLPLEDLTDNTAWIAFRDDGHRAWRPRRGCWCAPVQERHVGAGTRTSRAAGTPRRPPRRRPPA
jgi:hypothetical protein